MARQENDNPTNINYDNYCFHELSIDFTLDGIRSVTLRQSQKLSPVSGLHCVDKQRYRRRDSNISTITSSPTLNLMGRWRERERERERERLKAHKNKFQTSDQFQTLHMRTTLGLLYTTPFDLLQKQL